MKMPPYFSQLVHLGDISDVQQLREKLLRILLIIASVVGAILFALAMIPAVEGKLLSAVLIYSVFYAGLLGITFIPHISYRFRVNAWLFVLYIFGVVNLVFSGFNVDAGLFFMTYVIMAVLLLDLRKAIVAILLSLGSIAFMGFVVVGGNSDLSIGLSQRNPLLWMVGGTIFFLVGFITTISVSVLLHGLAENLIKVKKISSVLEQKNKEVLESELHFRSLVETSPDVIMRFDLRGKIEAVNLAGESMLGLPQEEILGKNLGIFLSPEEQIRVDHVLDRVLAEGVVRDVELSIRHKDGTFVPVEFSAAQILDARGDVIGVIGVGKHITEKKKAEELLRAQTEEIKLSQQRLRTLTHQLISAQENERRVIARELHDDAGQALVTLKHGISMILEELNDGKGQTLLEERLERSLELANQAIACVRSASHRLRPPALEVGGIDVGLEELCRQCSLQTRLQVSYRGENLSGIPDDLAISLYRFVQEALTNTLKHADASEADVRLMHKDDQIVLSVVDNGCGVRDGWAQQSGIGLLGLQERLALFSGRIDVDPRVARGYSITAIVPWKKETSR
ncbi:MAG: PAS domain S-box protein [Chloroflexi bacterium]|nr:PAS domain S-box protein [Chloroflexota bacterium]